MFCPKCGTTIDNATKFCPKCGNSIEAKIINGNHMQPVMPKKGNKAVIVLLAVLIVVVIAFAAMLAALFVAEQKEDIAETRYEQHEGEKENTQEKNSPNTTKKQKGNTTEAREVLDKYIKTLPQAVNTGNYSYIEPYILDGSVLYGMQVALVDYNYEKGITERFIEYSVEKVVWINSTTCNIYTEEEYEISFGGDSTYNEYEWKYTIVERDGRYYLTNLEKWD